MAVRQDDPLAAPLLGMRTTSGPTGMTLEYHFGWVFIATAIVFAGRLLLAAWRARRRHPQVLSSRDSWGFGGLGVDHEAEEGAGASGNVVADEEVTSTAVA